MNFFAFYIVWFFVVWYILLKKPIQKIYCEIMVCLPLVMFATGRDKFLFMVDTLHYVSKFLRMSLDRVSVLYAEEPGCQILQYIVKWLGGNVEIYFFLMAAGTIVLVNLIVRKYSPDYMMTWFLFFTNCYFQWCCNIMMQGLACAVLMLTVPFLIRKKYLICVGLVFLAMMFHYAALIFLPFIFICSGKAFGKYTLAAAGIIICMSLVLSRYADLINVGLKYTGVLQNAIAKNKGMSWIRLGFYLIPVIMTAPYYRTIWRINDPLVNVSVNMSVILSAFSFMACMTSGILIGRITDLFICFSYILLPWAIRHLYSRNVRIALYGMIIIVYLIKYYMEMTDSSLFYEHHFF